MSWRFGPQDTQDTTRMSEWERATYEYAREHALTRRKVLGLAGLGVGAALLDPLAAAQAAGSTAAQGGSLIVARGQATDTLDPQKTALLVAHEIMFQIYDSIIYLDEFGRIYPGLATAWKFSPDHLTLTFKLRRGVTFHDGTPFDAHAVKFSLDRHQAKATASPTAYRAGPLVRVEVVDPYTVAFHYTQPFVALWVGLSYSYLAPISPTAVKKYGTLYGRNPVGTGPYKFVSWTPDETITLAKNPSHTWSTSFYKDTNGSPLMRGPALDSVEFRVIPSDTTRVSALLSHEIDMIAGTNAVPDNQVTFLRKASGIQVVQRSAVGVYYATLNTKKPPLNDVRVRQAINYGVDKEKLIKLAVGGQGKPATSLVASAYGDYDPNVQKYPYDLAKAKALLKAAGADKGFSVDYLNIEGPEFDLVAQSVQEDLSKLGITMKITSVPVAQWAATGQTQKPAIGFIYYTYSDPDVVVLLAQTGSPFEWTYHGDKTLDAWLLAQRVEFNPAKRRAILYKIQERINKLAYYLYLWEGRYSVAARTNVKNIHIDLVGFIHAQEITKA